MNTSVINLNREAFNTYMGLLLYGGCSQRIMGTTDWAIDPEVVYAYSYGFKHSLYK